MEGGLVLQVVFRQPTIFKPVFRLIIQLGMCQGSEESRATDRNHGKPDMTKGWEKGTIEERSGEDFLSPCTLQKVSKKGCRTQQQARAHQQERSCAIAVLFPIPRHLHLFPNVRGLLLISGRVHASVRTMKLKQFVQEVQSRAHFRSEKEAVTAIQATLQTFGERLSPPEADELAAQLPGEIASYILLNQELPATPPSATGFFKRIALREGVDISMAVVHTRAVLGAIQKSCNDQTQTVAQSFPWPDITPLFEKVVFGSGRANGSMAAPAMS